MIKRSLLALGCLIVFSVSGWAGTQTSKGFLYKPNVGARGAAEKNLYDAGLDRVDARLGKEIWVGDPNYGTTLQAATTAIGSNNVILRVPSGAQSISADFTVPANITLKPERGAIFQIATTKTLTINGGFEAGFYQVFNCTGTGKVLFGPGAIKEVYPQWWGAKAGDLTFDQTPMFQAAIASLGAPGGMVSFPAGQYAVNVIIDAYNIILNGVSQTMTSNSANWLVPWDITKPVLQISNGTKYLRGGGLNNVTLYATGPNGVGQLGLKLAGGAYQWSGNNLAINGFTDKGLYGVSDANYAICYINFNNLMVQAPSSGSYTAAVYLDYGTNQYLTAINISNFNISSAAGGTGKALILDSAVVNLSNGWIQAPSADHGIQLLKSHASKVGIIAANVWAESAAGGAVIETFDNDARISSRITGSLGFTGTLKLLNGSTVAISSQFSLPYQSEMSYPHMISPYVMDPAAPTTEDFRLYKSGTKGYIGSDTGTNNINFSTGGQTSVEGGTAFRVNAIPLYMTPLAAAPTSGLTAGYIALANRTNWDPLAKGSGGPYLVWYNGSAWVEIFSGSNLVGVKVTVPANATAAGSPGQWAADTSYFYVYTGDGTTHTWRRVGVAAW